MSYNKDLHSKVSYNQELSNTAWDQIAIFISNFFSHTSCCFIRNYNLCTIFRCFFAMVLVFFVYMFFCFATNNCMFYYLLKSGKVTDFHISKRNQRIKPLLFIVFNTVVGIFLFNLVGGPKYLMVLAVCCLLTIVVMFFVTLIWKISGHCTAAGGLAVVAVSLLNESALPFTILIPIIAWSRVRLERHTVSQTTFWFLAWSISVWFYSLFYQLTLRLFRKAI